MESPAYTPEPPAACRQDEKGQRIVLFMFDFARTGVVANAVRLANALAMRGKRVWLLVCSAEGREQHRIDPAVGVVVARATSPLFRLPRELAMLLLVPTLRRRLRELAPGILVSAGNHGHPTAALAAAALPRMRLVLRISNELQHVGKGALASHARRLMHRRLIQRADRLLLVSPHLARHPLLAAALASGKAVITPNGVDAARVRQLAAAACPHPWLAGEVPVVVGVGRLAKHKNFDTLIRAVAHATQQRPLRLIIVGGGSDAERQRLLAVAQQLGISGQVHLQGEVANPFSFIARAGVFALPSLWEGASNVLLEALACDVPVVASRSAGNAQEALGDGRYGMLVDPLDVEAMAAALLHQTSADAGRPGRRVEDFAADTAVARVCAAICSTGMQAEAARLAPSLTGRT